MTLSYKYRGTLLKLNKKTQKGSTNSYYYIATNQL